MSEYNLLEHGGFVAHFTVELVFDQGVGARPFDLVGVEARCQQCGGRLEGIWSSKELWTALEDHTKVHKPRRRK